MTAQERIQDETEERAMLADFYGEELVAKARALVAANPEPSATLLPLLTLVHEAEGRITQGGALFCAYELSMDFEEVAPVARTFAMTLSGGIGGGEGGTR